MIFRRLGIGLAVPLMSLLLVVFAAILSAYTVLDKPDTLKNALRSSDVYRTFTASANSQEQTQAVNDTLFENPEVRKAFIDSFPASFLQKTSEHNIDATYAWLHGKVAQPNYAVDLSGPRAAFGDAMAKLAEEKVNALPTCTSVVAPPATTAGILALSCRPAHVPVSTLSSLVREQAMQASVFNQAGEAVRAATILQDEKGTPLTEKVNFVPDLYKNIILSLFIAPALVLICALVIVYLSQTRKGGVRRVAYIFLVTGVSSIIVAYSTMWLLDQVAVNPTASSTLIAIRQSLLEAARNVAVDLRNWWMGIGAAYSLIAIVLLLVVKLRQSHDTHHNEALNKSLGYTTSVPKAGTTFGPKGTAAVDAPDNIRTIDIEKAGKQPTENKK